MKTIYKLPITILILCLLLSSSNITASSADATSNASKSITSLPADTNICDNTAPILTLTGSVVTNDVGIYTFSSPESTTICTNTAPDLTLTGSVVTKDVSIYTFSARNYSTHLSSDVATYYFNVSDDGHSFYLDHAQGNGWVLCGVHK